MGWRWKRGDWLGLSTGMGVPPLPRTVNLNDSQVSVESKRVGRSGAIMQTWKYLFVDGGHLRQQYAVATQRWFGMDGELDFHRMKEVLGAHKCFYYDCVHDSPREGEPPTDLAARIANQEDRFKKIQEIKNTHVRLGSMTGSRKNRRQKKVDILLAVDALNHAFCGNMNEVILLTGDQDFVPVVDTLVNMGLFVTVAGDSRHTSMELARAADHYDPLSLRNYHDWTVASLKRRFPIPSTTPMHTPPGGVWARKNWHHWWNSRRTWPNGS